MAEIGAARPGETPAVRAAFLLVNDLALVLLRTPIAAAIRVDPLTPQGITRWAKEVTDVYTKGAFVTAPGQQSSADCVCERLDGQVDTRFTIDPDHLDAMIGRLHTARIHTLTVTPPSLDALFLRTYGEALDAREASESLAEPRDERPRPTGESSPAPAPDPHATPPQRHLA